MQVYRSLRAYPPFPLAPLAFLALLALVALAAGCSDAPAPMVPDAGPPPTLRCALDAQCDDGIFCNGIEVCAHSAPGAGEDGCAPASAPPCGAGLRCDETMAACVSDCAVERDADGDGHDAAACGGDDCNDDDPNRYPGNPEVCDAAGHDEDCDPGTFGGLDRDVDGVESMACCNGSACGTDCDDTLASVRPGATEVCDGRDNDCDGELDEGVAGVFYPDTDGDGYGDENASGTPTEDCRARPGFSLVATDCDDGEAAVNPAAFDRCDGSIDDDCSGAPDDPPGGCTCEAGETRACPLPGVCARGTQSCSGGLWTPCSVTAEEEACDGLDNDCDGLADEDCDCTPGTILACGIAAGECVEGVQVCGPDLRYSACVGGRGAADIEVCDGLDDDCDGVVDEDAIGGETSFVYTDADGDGFGIRSGATLACGVPMGFSADAGDCFDNDATVTCPTLINLEGSIGQVYDAWGTFASGDFDGDGDIDFMGPSGSAQLFRNEDGAGFYIPYGLRAEGQVLPGYFGAFGELDTTTAGDELVTSGDLGVFLMDGALAFTDGTEIIAGPHGPVAIGDFDGDGTADVAAAAEPSTQIDVSMGPSGAQGTTVIASAGTVTSLFVSRLPGVTPPRDGLFVVEDGALESTLRIFDVGVGTSNEVATHALGIRVRGCGQADVGATPTRMAVCPPIGLGDIVTVDFSGGGSALLPGIFSNVSFVDGVIADGDGLRDDLLVHDAGRRELFLARRQSDGAYTLTRIAEDLDRVVAGTLIPIDLELGAVVQTIDDIETQLLLIRSYGGQWIPEVR